MENQESSRYVKRTQKDYKIVETTAQVLPEKVNNADGHRMRIFRMLVQCCAADARPFSVPIDFGKKAPDFKDMTWVKVTGKVSYKKEGIKPCRSSKSAKSRKPPRLTTR